MSPADYADWCNLAGLYLGNHSHADRYRTFRDKLSSAGLTVRMVHDFLGDNPGGIDVNGWRTHCVYEVGEWAAFRVEQTALALEAVGAPRLASLVRSARDTSPTGILFNGPPSASDAIRGAREAADLQGLLSQFRESVARATGQGPTHPIPPNPDAESWEQLEHLLAGFTQAHQAELLADVARHGDPRTEPGFTPEKRSAELRVMRDAERDRERQAEDLAEMQAQQAEIERLLTTMPSPKPAQLAEARRQFLRRYRAVVRRLVAGLIPPVRDWLPQGRAFVERHAELFFPWATRDEALLSRLAALGEYDADPEGRRMVLSWVEPRGLALPWGSLTLGFNFPANNDSALRQMLDILDQTVTDLPLHAEEMRREILDSFERYREWPSASGIAWSEVDDQGQPTEQAILEQAGTGHVLVTYQGGDTQVSIYFPVTWDDEHGLDLGLVGWE